MNKHSAFGYLDDLLKWGVKRAILRHEDGTTFYLEVAEWPIVRPQLEKEYDKLGEDDDVFSVQTAELKYDREAEHLPR